MRAVKTGAIRVIARKGRLKPSEHAQLGEPDPQYDRSDIPLRINTRTVAEAIEVSDAYVPVQYRKGGLRTPFLAVKRFVNDGVSAWQGKIFVDAFYVGHTLPFFYDEYNHSDCLQFTGNKVVDGKFYRLVPVEDVRIDYVELVVTGKGAEKKGHIMLTEPTIYRRFSLFSKGLILATQSNAPAFNANNLRDSVLGSRDFPLNNEHLKGRAIRIMDTKPGSPVTKNVNIFAKPGVKFEFTPATRKGVNVIYC